MEKKEMKIVDLTHTIAESMTVFPGAPMPKLQQVSSYEENGYMSTLITIHSHTGTHMDAPAHAGSRDRTTLDQMPIEQFVGKAFVVDCTDIKEGQRITMDHINKDRVKADKAEFILFHLGWDKFWNSSEYLGEYPYIDDGVLSFLIDSNKKGVGFDVISIDPIASDGLIIHSKLFLNNEIVVIENLKNLDHCGNDLFTFCALPLKYKNSDGAPIRAIAILEK